MRHVAFITSKDQPGITASDAAVVPILQKKDVMVTAVPWESDTDWSIFDMAVMRSAWNYHMRYPTFLTWLDTLEKQHVYIWNAVPTLRWNTQKTYFSSMISRGIPMVPTRVITEVSHIPETFLPWDTIVIKPTVSASSYETKVYASRDAKHWQSHIRRLLKYGPVLAQEYMESIQNGEHSFVFFNKTYSHAVLKKPKNGDFRIQEEYGGTVSPITPSDTHIRAAQSVLEHIPEPLLYARVDGLIIRGSFILMEVELCEPELFLYTDSRAPILFAESIMQFLGHTQ